MAHPVAIMAVPVEYCTVTPWHPRANNTKSATTDNKTAFIALQSASDNCNSLAQFSDVTQYECCKLVVYWFQEKTCKIQTEHLHVKPFTSIYPINFYSGQSSKLTCFLFAITIRRSSTEKYVRLQRRLSTTQPARDTWRFFLSHRHLSHTSLVLLLLLSLFLRRGERSGFCIEAPVS